MALLPVKSVGEGLGVDVLAVTPGYVYAGNTARWTGDGGGVAMAMPEEVARASLLVLPTALGPQLPPLMSQIPIDAAAARWLLPESVLGSIVHYADYLQLTISQPTAQTTTHCGIVHSLHRGQRRRLAAADNNKSIHSRVPWHGMLQ